MSHLFGPIKLVVFDFDCTITSEHTCPRLAVEQVMEMPIGRLVDESKFKSFVNYLLRSGINVAIASYGKREVILATMNRVFGIENPFSEGTVITPQDVSSRWRECDRPSKTSGLNKNSMLSLLSSRFRLSPTEILLIDDDPDDISMAVTVGYQGIHVPPCKTFSVTLRTVLSHVMPPNLVDEFINMV